MMIGIRGIGWLTPEGFGCIRNGLRHVYESGEYLRALPKKDIFSHPFKNFGRLDAVSRMTAYAVSLALQDAGIEYSPLRKQDIGIVGTNAEGSLRADLEYFRDYLKSGRTLSRGNLFIYTLPSSAIGEAAIHFGLLGPALYAAGTGNSLTSALELAAEMIEAGQTPAVLAGKAEPDEAVFFLMQGDYTPGTGFLCDLDEARSVTDRASDAATVVDQFLRLAAGRG
jgi:3-oxoacyl-[acyl-carrier-protein] synthase II